MVAASYDIYVLQDAAGAYYVGYTSDLAVRVRAHETGRGGFHTKKLISPKLVYSESQTNLESALKRERQLKGWSRAKKHALIESRLEDLKKLSHHR